MHQVFTIDGPSSRDLDDALEIEQGPEYRQLHVFVADAAASVPAGGDMDLRAHERVETRYYASGAVPMLPRHISEDGASLLPGKKRGALRISLCFDAEGYPVAGKTTISLGTVQSCAQLHYGQVVEILGQPDHPLNAQLCGLRDLSLQLLNNRRRLGALALYDLQTGLLTSEEGVTRWVEQDQSTIGHIMVQEAMIAANQALAEFCVLRGIPVLFRNHEASAAAPPRAEMQRWLAEMTSVPRPVAEQRAGVLQTVLGRARYSPALRGHFGLGIHAYMHATSPIRRLADLVNHRQIRAELLGEPMLSSEDLGLVSQKINDFLDLQRDQKSAHLKEKADKLLSRRAGSNMSALEPKAFSRVVKLACRELDLDPLVLAEILRRCQAGTLQPLDSYFLLWRNKTDSMWEAAQAAVADFLASHPHVAASIAAISTSMASEAAPAAVLRPAEVGPEGRFFASACCWGQEAEGAAATKKAAEQLAAVGLFHLRAGLRVPSREGIGPPSSVRAAVAPLPAADALDPISELQMYCQALPAESPLYSFTEESRAGKPLFACRVTMQAAGPIEGRSVPRPNKKDAKREAAAEAIRQLRLLLKAES